MLLRAFLHDAIENNTRFTELNLSGLSPEELRSPVGDGGNSVAWIVGHITFWRNAIAQNIDPEVAILSAETSEVFRGVDRGASPGLGDNEPDAILAAFRSSKDIVRPLFDRADDAALSRSAHLMVHESYHVGQLGVIRRMLGHPGAVGR